MRRRRAVMPHAVPVLARHLLRDVDDSGIRSIEELGEHTHLITMHNGWRYIMQELPASRRVELRRKAFAYRSLHERGLPAPQIFAAAAEPQPALLLEYLPGRPLSQVLAESPQLASMLLPELGRLLKRVHAITFPQGGLFTKDGPDPVRPAPYTDLPTFLHVCGDRLAALVPPGILTLPHYARIIDLLHAQAEPLLAAEYRRRSFVHGSFQADHLLVHELDGVWQISGILGMQDAGAGDRWHDILTFDRAERETPALRLLLDGYGEQPDPAAYRVRLVASLLSAATAEAPDAAALAFFRSINNIDPHSLTPDFGWVPLQ